ncbi:MFS transporter [Streptomyces sp. NPDC044571]|uniref:MFS transporter n=1 Tax=Streptomyces sp. NPDC044571 TaxID=3155371 RepID=UPI0033DDF16E
MESTPGGSGDRPADPTATNASAVPEPPRALIPALIFIALVVAAIGSLGAPLVPSVAAAEGVSLAAAQWTLTITLLVGAVATPLLGRLGDGPRRREVVLATLATATAGGLLTALPLGFTPLLLGRALQGVGLGLPPLMIAVARDTFDGPRRRSIVSLLSVTTVAGVGIGYPVAGAITQYAGLRSAYATGAGVTALALLAAVLLVPPSPPRPKHRLDALGAVLLGACLSGLLFAISEAAGTTISPATLLGIVIASLFIALLWVRHELRTPHPLVDLRLLRNRSVLAADLTVLLGGASIYLLTALIIRLVQTPTAAGYGFGSTVIVAGSMLVPMSALSFAASRATPALTRHITSAACLPLGCTLLLTASLIFAITRTHLWELYTVMAISGLGIGTIFAAIPGLIIRAVPATETGSALGFNQVLRTIGFSIGSALSALILQAKTPTGQALPTADGYTTAALVGAGLVLATITLTAALRPRHSAASVS